MQVVPLKEHNVIWCGDRYSVSPLTSPTYSSCLLPMGQKLLPLESLIWVDELPPVRSLIKYMCLFLFDRYLFSIYYMQSTILDVNPRTQRKIRYDQFPKETLLSGGGGDYPQVWLSQGCVAWWLGAQTDLYSLPPSLAGKPQASYSTLLGLSFLSCIVRWMLWGFSELLCIIRLQTRARHISPV